MDLGGIGRKSGRNAQLWSRNQKDFTRRFPDVVNGVAELVDISTIFALPQRTSRLMDETEP
jgi:hypothetical protein